MTDSKMEKDPIMEAVGFRMNNLKSIPFSRLPGNVQLEVIEEWDWEEKIKLVNVSSGFRGYYARNGIFERHVHGIKIFLQEKVLEDGEAIDLHLRIYIEKGSCRLHFDLFKEQALFRNICSCTRFVLDWEDIFYTFPNNTRRMEELFEVDADGKKILKWFPNLRFVEHLSIRESRNPLAQEMLESFHFKVTDFARIDYDYLNLVESRHWEHLLANHLRICEKVMIKNFYSGIGVPHFQGMVVERDTKKKKAILNTFKKFESRSSSLADFFRRLAHTPLPIHCYRRKIDENKEMIMLAYYYDSSLL